MGHRVLVLLSLPMLYVGCQPEGGRVLDGASENAASGGGTNSEFRRIDDYVIDLGTPRAAASAIVEKAPRTEQTDGNYVCTSQPLEETRRFDKLTAYVGNSHALYPGAIVGADSVETGTFAPLVLPRAPLTFSAGLQGVVEGSLQRTLEPPNLGGFREAMHAILTQRIIGQPPARVAAEIEQVHSAEQLDFALDVNASIPEQGDLVASLRFADKNTHSRFVMRFTQAYFTVDVEPPARPSAMFSDEATLEEIAHVMDDEPPAYVSSITYGRTILITVASSHSSTEVEAALDFAYEGDQTADGSVSLTHSEVLEQSEINAFILGGNGQAASEAVFSVERLKELVASGGTWSRESPGAPIAYKLAWLADNSPARWSTTLDYDAIDCERVTQNVRVALRSLTVDSAGSEGTLELYGDIAVVDESGTRHDLWSIDSSAPVEVGQGETYPGADDVATATVAVTPGPGGTFDLVVDMFEDDPIGNDEFGLTTISRPYEAGWRGEVTVPVVYENQRVTVTFELLPVE